MKKNYKISDYELTLSCAFRYALGRSTYVVHHIATEILDNWKIITPSTLERFKKEILEYKKDNGHIGMECDEQIWMVIVNKPLYETSQ